MRFSWPIKGRLRTRHAAKQCTKRSRYRIIHDCLEHLEERALLASWSGTLAEDTTWTNDEVQTVSSLTIPAGVKLTVEPGTVVKFGGLFDRIVVVGELDAQGTVDQNIFFTSIKDDTVGGDTNEDGGATQPAPGDWYFLSIPGVATISHSQIRYGGYGGSEVDVNGGNLTLADSTISDSSSVGVDMRESDPTLTDNVYRDNTGDAIRIHVSSSPSISGGTVHGNGLNAVRVTSGSTVIGLQKDTVWDSPDIPYWLDWGVVVPAGLTLTVGAGQVVKTNSNISVDGTLTAEGTAEAPAVFTSHLDDSAGGDSNADGAATSPAAGNWSGITLNDSSLGNTISHAQLRYGNVLTARSTDLTVSNAEFVSGAGNALRLDSTDAALTNTVYRDNVGAAISMDLNSNPVIRGVTLVNNGLNGLELNTGLTLQALARDLTWNNPDITYWLSRGVVVPAGLTLTIDAGQIVKVNDVLWVDGTLNVNGTAAAPVVFTSHVDDSVGGDTNADGAATSPAPGGWSQILFQNGSTGNTINHARILYGAGAVRAINGGTHFAMTNSLVRDSSSDAVAVVFDARADLSGNLLVDNAGTGIFADLRAKVVAINNTISGNDTGVYATGTTPELNLINNLITFNTSVGVNIVTNNAITNFSHNDVFNPGAENFVGVEDPSGADGNISVDPLYIDAQLGNFNLGIGSPAVDAAFGTGAPATDYAGNPRVDDPAVANTGGGIPDYVDIGAIERDPWTSEIIAPIRSGAIVAGDSLRLRGNGSASPGPTRYEWSLGDGRTSNQKDPGVVAFNTPGVKNINFATRSGDGVRDPDPASLAISVVADGNPLPDLDVLEVELPDGLSTSALNRVDYTAVNVGAAAVPAISRVDALYLSRDGFLDSGDHLLGTRDISQGVAVGQTYAGSFSVALPEHLLASGVNYLIVSLDDEWDILERRQLNNEQALLTTDAIPVLTDGETRPGTFASSGTGHYYQIDVASGDNLLVSLDDLNDQGRNEVYARFGAIPTRGQFDFRATKLDTADQQLLVPAAAPGTWFILVYGGSVQDDGAYTIRAETDPLSLLGVTPDHHGNSIDTVMTITGAGFQGTTSVELIADDNTTYDHASLDVDSFSQLTVTFDTATNSIPAGVYDVRVTSAGSNSATLIDAFEFVEGGTAQLEIDLTVPSSVGYHQLATLWVEYSNTGDVAMPAPIIGVTADQEGRQAGLLTLDSANLSRGFWTSAIPEGFSNSVQFLGSGGTAGVLQPGETMRVPVYYAGWQQPWDLTYPPINFYVSSTTVDDTTPIDWAEVKDQTRPSTIDTEAWNAIWTNYTSQIGTTAGELVRTLSENATYLARLGTALTDIGELAAFEVRQADGLLDSPYLDHAIDTEVDATGLSLNFDRAYRNPISGRYALGVLGRGWTHTWEMELSEDLDGNASVTGVGPSLRYYQPDSRGPGRYFSRNGDTTELRKLGDGTFELSDKDGVTYSFAGDGRFSGVSDRNGNGIDAAYTGDLLTSLTHTSGESLTLAYDANDRLMQLDDSQGRTVTYGYDASGEHLMSATTPAGTTQYTYVTGQGAAREHALESITGADGTQLIYAYDAQGRLSETAFAGGFEPLSYSYDTTGNIMVTDAAGATSTVSMNHFALISRVEDALQRSVGFEYDSLGNLTSIVEPNGHHWEYAYDASGNLTSFSDPLGAESRIRFDSSLDKPKRTIDPLGNTWDFRYDAAGNLTQLIDPAGIIRWFSYDAQGNQLTRTNARGTTDNFAYDDGGRTLTQTQGTATLSQFTYDTRGNVLTATDAQGETTTYQYDAADRMTRIEDSDGRFLAVDYDTDGRRAQLTDQTGAEVNYEYDAVGRLTRLADASDTTMVEYVYDNVGRLSRENHSNGTFTTYQYSAAGDVTNIVHHASDTLINSSFEYTYDGSGRRTGASTSAGDWIWKYDGASQLVSATRPDGTVIQYQYDAAGNRAVVTDNGVVSQYAVNELNQYTDVNGIAYTWDADGNLVEVDDSGSVTTYAYDSDNRLIAVNTPTDAITYQYDAFGNRTAMTVNGIRTEYFVDPAGFGNVVGIYDNTGARESQYVYGADNTLVQREDTAGNRYYYDYDAIGSTVGVTDATAGNVNSYQYDPFGETVTLFESFANPFQFVGQFGVMDDPSGLEFMRNRFYDSDTGRFISQDPIGFEGGSLNLYQYARNNPIEAIDPNGDFGIFTVTILIGIGAGVAFAAGVGAAVYPTAIAIRDRANTSTPTFDLRATHKIDDQEISKDTFGRTSKQVSNRTKFTEQTLQFPSAIDHSYVSIPGVVIETVNRLLAYFGRGSSQAAQSVDPNEKTGPGLGENGYLADGDLLAYRIDFENDPSASAGTDCHGD